MEEEALNIFTDGSSFSKPRRGGFGIRFIYIDCQGCEKIEDIPIYYSYPNATNNQMELYACVRALDEALKSKYLSIAKKIIIFSDSRYVVNNYLNALFTWPKNKWLSKDHNPVANAEIWKELLKKVQKIHKRVEIKWVKGHAKNEHNRAVDKFARNSAKSNLKEKPLSIVNVRRKRTSEKVQPGCIEMKGQRLSIRIITDEFLSVQKINKYRYEVTSKNSKYFGLVDFIYSSLLLKAGHEYIVTFNKSTKTPRIMKCLKEIS